MRLPVTAEKGAAAMSHKPLTIVQHEPDDPPGELR
jgi:hypothetical protein